MECIERKELTTIMKQGLIILIPKSGKNKIILNNLRLITLLNAEYKILAAISNIISVTQSAFLKGRSIHNNIRPISDLVDYSEVIQKKGFLLFLDFYKAFDSVEHPFILKTFHC